jgi:hypothetical protein
MAEVRKDAVRPHHICKCTDDCCRELSAHVHVVGTGDPQFVDAVELMFPPGCNCERISVDTSSDAPGTRFIRGHSDPPCRVHLPEERRLYDAGYHKACEDAQAIVMAEVDHARCATRANNGIAQLSDRRGNG